MSERSCELHFAGGADVQLVEFRFTDRVTGIQRITVRGKTAGAFRNAGTFQWTSAVRGLCILMARAKIACLQGTASDVGTGQIVGHRASMAASLDYAITKQPAWTRDMFGSDMNGTTLVQRLIHRTNPNRKRPGPVILALNERALSAVDVAIYWDGHVVQHVGELRNLLLKLGDTDQADVSRQVTGEPSRRIAA
jgi:hypothetical protein